jgi:homospermidine synthase
VQVIQIAERDTQEDGRTLAPGEFACTWSVEGLLAEARQAPELGWGSHEECLYPGMQTHDTGCQASVVWWPESASAPLRRIKSWTPAGGEQRAWLITHNEAISLADFLTLRNTGSVVYRPTVYYAYSPCRATQSSLEQWQASGYRAPATRRLILPQDIASGSDELGVLLCFPGGAYWYGSTLGIEQARCLAPGNSATSLQVAAGVLAALKWAMRHPKCGVLEAEQMDSVRVLRYALPYLGEVKGTLSRWQPKVGAGLQLGNFLEDCVGETDETGSATPGKHPGS